MNTVRNWWGRRQTPGSAGKVRPAEAAAPHRMIVGLGNPGPEYSRSRHNIGFQIADLLALRHGMEFDRFQKRARLAIGWVRTPGVSGQRVLLAKPMTFMNASGEAVAPLAAFYKIVPAHILVVFDDLDLPVGRIRLRPGGSSGGQKGMQSIIKHLGTTDFPRLRVGIGRPPGQMDPADYVLRPFSPDQETEMVFVRTRAAEAIEAWLTGGVEAAMNQFNSAKDE
jgi:peptidyl-tRNA hydrolase, PTH1 family